MVTLARGRDTGNVIESQIIVTQPRQLESETTSPVCELRVTTENLELPSTMNFNSAIQPGTLQTERKGTADMKTGSRADINPTSDPELPESEECRACEIEMGVEAMEEEKGSEND